MTLRRTFALVRELRRADEATPTALMGYYNPIYRYGPESFAHDAVAVGVDGVIVVDLSLEEDAELTGPARAAGLDFVRLATPTSDEKRLPKSPSTPRAFSITSQSAALPEPLRRCRRCRRCGHKAAPVYQIAGRGRVLHPHPGKLPRSRAPPTPPSRLGPRPAPRLQPQPTTPPSPALSTPSSPMSAPSPRGCAGHAKNEFEID